MKNVTEITVLAYFVLMLSGCENNAPKMRIDVNKNRLYTHVDSLSHTASPRSYMNAEGINAAGYYIEAAFREHSDDVVLQPFIVQNNEYRNVICSFGIEHAERIIIGAHYDVCEDQPGADDNASGVAGLLELARLLKSSSDQLSYRVDLAAYSLEEPPFYDTEFMGSTVHAKWLKNNGVKVKVMISLEMIGYFDDTSGSQDFPFWPMKLIYPDTGDFIGVISNFRSCTVATSIKKLMREGSKIDVRQLTGPAFIPGVSLSDHHSFWKSGFNAIMITDTAFFRNPNYHLPGDTIDTLDFDKMAEVIKGVYWAVLNLK